MLDQVENLLLSFAVQLHYLNHEESIEMGIKLRGVLLLKSLRDPIRKEVAQCLLL